LAASESGHVRVLYDVRSERLVVQDRQCHAVRRLIRRLVETPEVVELRIIRRLATVWHIRLRCGFRITPYLTATAARFLQGGLR
jgi:hypothetical protein